MRFNRVTPLLLTTCCLLGACGSSAAKSATTTAAPGKDAPAKDAATTTKAGVATTAKGASTSAAQTKPVMAAKTGTPPTSLVSTDLVLGTGAVAVEGKTVSVQYVGVRFADGKQFDASWDRGQPFSFQLGAGRVIKGWDQGVAGMKVGGRRELVIPPALAYGNSGAGAEIKPGDTLVFVVDLLSVT